MKKEKGDILEGNIPKDILDALLRGHTTQRNIFWETTDYEFVPIQDFTILSDIDWSKSVAEIDQQLYAKYGLDESEISFIASKIKPME